ncbi:MAG: MATE family efflux transporter [Clostridiales bacterium]|nr:MATE family efflux transporter [Clostridiales bacterium]
MKNNHKDTRDLTKGPIGRALLLFALPLLGSSLVQQLYNAVDLIFVGNLLGKEASAAVGAGGLLLSCLVDFFVGLGVGVSVIVSQAFGAGKTREMRQTIHTAAGFTLAASLIFMVLGWVTAPVLLNWMNTPAAIFDMALIYMRIYFLSLFSIIGYNIGGGVLRALGNSRSPLIYQLLGGLANVFGNTLFIYILKLGVMGAALSTLLSQTVAAFLVFRHLFRLPEEYRLRLGEIRILPYTLKNIMVIGIPSGVQAMGITLSNLVMQSQINLLGVDSIAAFTAFYKVDSFAYLPILAVGQAATTFCGQNLGAGRKERARQGIGKAILLGIAVAVGCGYTLLFLSHPAFRLFARDEIVIQKGIEIAYRAFPFYSIYVTFDVLSAGLRGAGRALPSMLIILGNMCGIRMIALYIMMRIMPTVGGVATVYPITWATTLICFLIYYKYQGSTIFGKISVEKG